MNYKNRCKVLKKLIKDNYPNYKFDLIFDKDSDQYLFKIIVNDNEIISGIYKDVKWEIFNKKIREQILASEALGKDRQCNICFNKNIVDFKACIYCSYLVCTDCWIKIERNNGIFKCPICKKYMSEDLEPGVDFLKYLMDLYDVKYDINNRRKVLMPLWLKTMDYINCPCCKST